MNELQRGVQPLARDVDDVVESMKRKVGLIPAAGMARRLGITTPKELIEVDGRAVIEYSVDHMVEVGIDHIVIVIREGKEAIREHLEAVYPSVRFEYVYQTGTIGNLLDALKTATDAVRNAEVYFLMPDTIITPNPFSKELGAEIALMCFDAAGDAWRNFGVVVPEQGQIVDKPEAFVGSTCWGALVWNAAFTNRLSAHDNLTVAINESDWEHHVTIAHYEDIGVPGGAGSAPGLGDVVNQ